MFTYVCLGTNNLELAIRFYDPTMAALNLQRCDMAGEDGWEGWAGWGTYENGGAREVALWVCKPFDGRAATSGNGTMVAFRAGSWREVEAFHAAALAHGGICEGPPGLRLKYAVDFYAAYVRDPDGNKLCAFVRK